MILKGSQRGGGQSLAVHLMRADDNEHVEIHEIRGFASDDLRGAFKEAHAVSRGTKCQQYLFSLSLNPPETESVSIAVFEDAISRIESKLGLSGQPRAIIFHEKEGRRHAHCVWSRIDSETMTARQLPHYKLKLRDISRDLYLEQDWKMPRGLMNSESRDPTNFTLPEWQQAKRAGYDPKELKKAIQGCWAVSDGRASFTHALEVRGFFLAKGDRRGFVVVDHQGEVHSLARALGIKTKDLLARLGDSDGLRNVQETKQFLARLMTTSLRRHIDQARAAFKHKNAALEHNRAVMTKRHRAERRDLDQYQDARRAQEARTRAGRFRKGVRGLWDRVTGAHGKTKKRNQAEALQAQKRDTSEREALVENHLHDRRSLQENIKEARSGQAKLLRDLRREVGHCLQSARIDDRSVHQRPRSRQRRPR